jgi:pyruvate,water dikinase
MTAIIPLPAPDGASDDVTRIGGKARGLVELMRTGAPVPPAFVIPPDVDVDAPDFRKVLEEKLAALGDVPVAVRSSGIVEDGQSASFAGIYETVLDVRGTDAVLDAVKKCRGSADAERVKAYGDQRGLGDLAGARIAVVVQRLVKADAAGVAFSADPVARRRDRCVIEAVPGLGESLVSGHANPDRAVVDRTNVVVERSVVSGCLNDALARKVAARAVALEEKLGFPVDIEWAVERGELWLLQVRPITTRVDSAPTSLPAPATTPPMLAAPLAGPRTVWTNTNAAELLPDVARPMVFSIVERYVSALLGPVISPFGIEPAKLGVVGLIGGRVYFNINAVIGWARAFPGLGRFRGETFASLLGGNHEALSAALRDVKDEDIPFSRVPLASALKGSLRVTWAVLKRQRGDASDLIAAIRAQNDRDASIELSSLGDEELVAYFDRLTKMPFGNGVDDDDGAVAAAMIGLVCQAGLPRLTKRWLGDDDGVIAGRLLQGMGGLESAEAGLAMWRLGALARSCGVVGDLEGTFDEVRARLDQAADGRRFLQGFSAFLRKHGHHARGECDVSIPRWAEQPDYVLRLVRAAAASQESTASDEAARMKQRRQLLEEISGRLSSWKRRILLGVVERAARGAAARENGKSEAIRRLFLARTALLEVGRRAKLAGSIGDVEDVFFLVTPEDARSEPGRDELRLSLAGTNLKGVVAARKRDHERNLVAIPPPVVVGSWDPNMTLPLPEVPAGALKGIAASPGVVEGRARVVLHADDDTVMQPGEILIAPFTDPGWTPYFLHAAGVVMDFGGMLSHGSVVAREYGLPAVVNVGPATKAIRTGQRVRVDGDRGVVEVLD